MGLGEGVARLLVLLLALWGAGCASETVGPQAPARPSSTGVAGIIPPSLPRPLTCVPYARLVSGIALYGDAWTWWHGSEGSYARGSEPRAGVVLVWRRTDRLQRGHLAVVTQVVGPREIKVSHANWGSDARTRHQVREDVPVIDASSDNTWQEVRVWNDEAGVYGAIYPAYGFVYPDRIVASSN